MESSRMRGFRLLKEAVDAIRDARPNERSEVSRRFAIVITMLDKAVAFYHYFIIEENDG